METDVYPNQPTGGSRPIKLTRNHMLTSTIKTTKPVHTTIITTSDGSCCSLMITKNMCTHAHAHTHTRLHTFTLEKQQPLVGSGGFNGEVWRRSPDRRIPAMPDSWARSSRLMHTHSEMKEQPWWGGGVRGEGDSTTEKSSWNEWNHFKGVTQLEIHFTLLVILH